MSNILVIDDDVAICRTVQLHFSSEGHDVKVAHSAEEGLERLRSGPTDVVILDIRMAGRSGLEILPEIKAAEPETPVIMITAFHDMESTIEAMQSGADDYIHKPMDLGELDAAVAKALRYREMRNSDTAIDARSSAEIREGVMVGGTNAMKEVFKTIGRVAKSSATVLITGESGTGKELVARAIHRAGPNPEGSLVAVNCAAMVETLLESDLFGHEKGAFTGAVSRQIGKFALAHDGTIFLDEVSELSPGIQAKLLRVLERKEFTPVGSKETHSVNARVIAATNIALEELTREGLFREDLYYRLQVVTINLPPLRERRADIPALVENLLTRINRQMRRSVSRVPREVIECLQQYDWPGNVRELENVLTKAVAVCPGEVITLDMLPPDAMAGAPRSCLEQRQSVTELSLFDVEREHVAKVLASTGWHRGRACEILGVSRPRLRRLIKQYGLTPPDLSTLRNQR